MTDTLTTRDRKEIWGKLHELRDRREELQFAVDDAAEADDGEAWERANDRLEYTESHIDELEELLLVKGES